MKNIIYIIAFFSLLTISCNKDDDTTPEPTASELLVSGKWYLDSYNGSPSTTCERQSYFHFTDSFSLVVDFFNVNSSSGVCQSTGFSGYTYTINSNNQIVVNTSSSIVVYQIISLTRTSLNLERQLPSGETIQFSFAK